MHTFIKSHSRREFIRRAAIAGAFGFPAVRRAVAGSANNDVRVGVIGLGGKGSDHVRDFQSLPGVKISAVCDVDPTRMAAVVDTLKKAGISPFTTNDPRRIIDRTDVDVVVIATPNHWHALLAVWACRAGKDVYVEKPVSHSIWEGGQIIAAARQHGRIVQSGTQFRSDEGLQEAAAWLREGHLGRPQWGHVVWYEYRRSIGRVAPYQPDWLNYDMYCGPAPLEPLTRPQLHSHWHWVWSTGDGDLANSGIHAFDTCRWFAGATGLPRRALSLGGRFAFDDVGQTPNTQLTVLDYPDLPIMIEDRNLPTKAGVKAMDALRGIREGFVLQYENGYFAGLRGGGAVYDRSGAKLRNFHGDGGGGHQANFIAAVRSRRVATLNAPIEEGHISSAVCHLGNISCRLGKPASANACRDAVNLHPRGAETVALLEQNLLANGVDLTKQPLALGPWLEMQAGSDVIQSVGGGDPAGLADARRLARGSHRAGYQFEPTT